MLGAAHVRRTRRGKAPSGLQVQGGALVARRQEALRTRCPPASVNIRNRTTPFPEPWVDKRGNTEIAGLFSGETESLLLGAL